MIRVVLVDDEQIIVNGLKHVVPWERYGCEVVGSAGDGQEGAALIRRLRPDLVLTDIRMPNVDGLTMIAGLKSEFPNMQVCILTAFREFEYAQKAISLGVARYLLKPSRMEELCEAVEYMTAQVSKGAPEEGKSEEEGKEGKEEGKSEASDFVVAAAMQYIRAHFAEHLHLSDVADNVFVSQWHLSKLINRHMGKTFFDILNEQRVEAAKALLVNPALKVHEVADRVGFADVAHFSKTFKRLVGKSPVEYRSGLA